jgi:hypothetical protein
MSASSPLPDGTADEICLSILARRYVLTLRVLGRPAELEISGEEFEAAKQAHVTLQRVVGVEEKFDALARNYIEFEGDLLKILVETSLGGFGQGMETMAVKRLINQRVCNVLSAARGYIDHVRRTAKQILPTPELADGVLSLLSQSFDRSFSYRLLEALRNYTQHAGFAVQAVSFGHKVLHDEPGAPIKATVSPLLDVDEVLADDAIKGKVRQELAEMQASRERVDLKVHTREYIASLAEVHRSLREHSASLFEEAAQAVQGLVARYRAHAQEGQPLGLVAVELNGGNWVRDVPLSTGLAEYGEHLAKSNLHFMHAGVTFFSSEPDDSWWSKRDTAGNG